LLASAGPLCALPSLLAPSALLRRASSLVSPGSAAALRSLAGFAGGLLASAGPLCAALREPGAGSAVRADRPR